MCYSLHNIGMKQVLWQKTSRIQNTGNAGRCNYKWSGLGGPQWEIRSEYRCGGSWWMNHVEIWGKMAPGRWTDAQRPWGKHVPVMFEEKWAAKCGCRTVSREQSVWYLSRQALSAILRTAQLLRQMGRFWTGRAGIGHGFYNTAPSGCPVGNRLRKGKSQSRKTIPVITAKLQMKNDTSLDQVVAVEVVRSCWVLGLFKGRVHKISWWGLYKEKNREWAKVWA